MAISSHPSRGATTVRALRSMPRAMASAHCSAVMAKRRDRAMVCGTVPPKMCDWKRVST